MTLKHKLPQVDISTKATSGYSSYGNQIGLATTYVKDVKNAPDGDRYIDNHLYRLVGGKQNADAIYISPSGAFFTSFT